ncbi:hypothetical protein ACS0TY_023889 [Phlomoides rotata]
MSSTPPPLPPPSPPPPIENVFPQNSNRVKLGTLFDNILISDNPEYAKKLAEETWGKQNDCRLRRLLLTRQKRREKRRDQRTNQLLILIKSYGIVELHFPQ